jgi:hypothetical protein
MDTPSQFRTSSCPYLGTHDDPSIHYRFTTPSNYCCRPDPAEAVSIPQQGEICLTREYINCPVYQPGWEGSLPPELSRIREKEKPKYNIPPNLWIWVLAGLGLIFILILVLVNPFGIKFNNQVDPVTVIPLPSNTPTIVQEAVVPVPSDLPVATNTPPNTATPSITPSPTSTLSVTPSIPTPGPFQETPFITNRTYLIHQINEGESIPLLSNHYQTSPDVIRTVNALRLKYGFLPDLMIIIMPGQIDVGELEALNLIYLETEVFISDFASQNGLTVEEVRVLNGLGPGETIPSGRWLIYPEREILATPTFTQVVGVDLSKALTEPFGPNKEFILHQVKSGESLSMIEGFYLTSAEVIRKVNKITGSVQIDRVLVILLNQTDPSDVPLFEVVNIDEEISVNDLALELGVPAADLVYYNGLESDTLIPAGQWIIYQALP